MADGFTQVGGSIYRDDHKPRQEKGGKDPTRGKPVPRAPVDGEKWDEEAGAFVVDREWVEARRREARARDPETIHALEARIERLEAAVRDLKEGRG